MAAIAFARLGYDTRYLRLAPFLATDRRAMVLAEFGVRALSYEEIQGGIGKYFTQRSALSRQAYERIFRDSPVEQAIADSLCMSDEDRERFSLANEHYLSSELAELCELIMFATEISNADPGRPIRIVTAFTKLSQTVISWGRESNKNIELVSLPRVLSFGGYLIRGLAKYLSVKKAAFQGRHVTAGQQQSPETSVLPEEISNEIIFFPHKGIYYGDLFLKDHYYSNDPASPFHPTRILHLSLGEPKAERARTDQYYALHQIPNSDLHALGAVAVRRWAFDYIRLIWRGRHRWGANSKKRTSSHFAFYFARYCHLRLYLSGLERLPRAKIALVGYDVLFPPMLSVALALHDIVTVATQERFFAPFQGIYRLIFDYYLPVGPRVCRFLSDHPRLARLGHCDPIGPVRAEDISARQTEFPEKYSAIKRERKLILALDFHSETTAVANARAMANNWRTNKRFYLDMIRLAIDFPHAHIVLKGKDTNATTLSQMQDIMSVIGMMPNISFETDLSTYSPSLMAAMADLAVACHTSLVDEMLAVGKPALIYDFIDHPTSHFGYDQYPVIVKTYQELRLRVAELIEGSPLMPSDMFAEMRQDYYSYGIDNLSARLRLHNRLEDIYHQVNGRVN